MDGGTLIDLGTRLDGLPADQTLGVVIAILRLVKYDHQSQRSLGLSAGLLLCHAEERDNNRGFRLDTAADYKSDLLHIGQIGLRHRVGGNHIVLGYILRGLLPDNQITGLLGEAEFPQGIDGQTLILIHQVGHPVLLHVGAAAAVADIDSDGGSRRSVASRLRILVHNLSFG